MIEFKGPDKDIIRLTEMILKQNQDIIEMNKRMLKLLDSTPVVINDGDILPYHSDASSYRFGPGGPFWYSCAR